MHLKSGCSYLALRIACMWDSLKQNKFVKENIKAHNEIFQLADNKARQIKGMFFMLSSGISNKAWPSSSTIKIAKTIEETYQKACNAEQKARFATYPYNGKNGQTSSSNSWGHNIYVTWNFLVLNL